MLSIKEELKKLKTLLQVGCKRKTTSCSLRSLSGEYFCYTNGPSSSVPCNNEVGNCGCAHAEPRIIMAALTSTVRNFDMVSVYSPCTNCANIIVDSGIVNHVFYEILTEHDKRGIAILEAGGVRVSQVQQTD